MTTTSPTPTKFFQKWPLQTLRQSLKKCSPHNWWKVTSDCQAKFTDILFVPPTPHGGLAKALRKREKELNENSNMKIRIIEKGGLKMKHLLSNPEPIQKRKCEVLRCPFCQPFHMIEVDSNQRCEAHNVGYEISCNSCQLKYEGETHRKISVRGSEHVKALMKKDKNSPLYKHLQKHHPEGGCTFRLKVIRHFKDALTHQVDEAVRIQNLQGLCMNSKSEFWAPPIKRITITDAHTRK